jgi:hypothetical protein
MCYTECPRRKVNILGGHSICHSKLKVVYVHVSYSCTNEEHAMS